MKLLPSVLFLIILFFNPLFGQNTTLCAINSHFLNLHVEVYGVKLCERFNQNVTAFLFYSKTKNGFTKISFQKLNSTHINDTITLIHSNYGISKIIIGDNISNKIFIQSFSRTIFKIYNGIETFYYFNHEIFKNHFLVQNSTFVIKTEVNYYTPMKDENDEISVESEIFLFDFKTFQDNSIMAIRGIEQYHPAIFSFSLLFHILVLIGCILFRNTQPLKAHGYIPLLASFMITFKILLGAFHFIPYVSVSIYLTFYLENIVYAPTYYCFFLILPFNLIRFFMLSNLNNYKVDFKAKVYKKSICIRIMIFLSKKITIPTFLFVIFILSLIFQLMNTILFDSITSIYFANLFLYVVTFFSVIVGTLLMIIDFISLLISNFPSKQRGICSVAFNVIKKIFREDVLYFRIQNYFAFLILLPIWFIIILVHGLELFYFRKDEITFILFLLLGSLFDNLFEFYVCGLLLFISCVTRVKLFFSKKTENSVLQIFDDKELWGLFAQFSRFEFSSENIECYQDIQQFKSLKSGRIEYLNQMKSFYFMSDSQLEVNISNKIKSEFKEKLAQGDENDDILGPIEFELAANLADTWSRFILTQEYQRYDLYKGILEQQTLLNKNS
jgi:hypothetical protein